jgi:hypothetical protein
MTFFHVLVGGVVVVSIYGLCRSVQDARWYHAYRAAYTKKYGSDR